MAYGVINVEQMTTQSGYTLGAGNASSFKNRIINGAMVIDQRNAGASVTPANGDYFVDRWNYGSTQASKFTAQRSTTAPTGFTNSILMTTAAAVAIGAGDIFNIDQRIEGFNVADLGWGTASAQTVTLSFWVRSSLTGTFGGAVLNSGFNRSYPFSYTISAANTFEYKTITIAGDISGTWLTTNGIGIRLSFGLGVGSTYSGTAGAWAGSGLLSATGAVSVVGTSGATFYITGVQLEVGTVATSFDYRSIGTETALCQRYFYSFKTVGISTPCLPWSGTTTNRCFANFTHPTTMRATPSVTTTGQFYNSIATTAPSGSATSVSAANITFNGNDTLRLGMDNNESGGTLWGVYVTGTASAEL
jgi:hypothetical protein